MDCVAKGGSQEIAFNVALVCQGSSKPLNWEECVLVIASDYPDNR